MEESRKKVAVVSHVPLNRDGRVLRQIDALKEACDVDVYAPLSEPMTIPGTTLHGWIVEERHDSLFRKFLIAASVFFFPGLAYRLIKPVPEFLAHTRDVDWGKYDYLVVNDIHGLPAMVDYASKCKKKPSLIFDAHEYSLGDTEAGGLKSQIVQRLKVWMCDYAIPKVDFFITVTPHLFSMYEARYPSIKDGAVIMNCPAYSDKTLPKLDNGMINLVHHGGTVRARQLERMADAVKFLPADHMLHFILMVNDASYAEELKRRVEENGLGDRVRFWEPVAPDRIVEFISQFDIGVYLLPPANLNCVHALPNKLFEFITARLPVAISPNVEMKRVVEEHGIGEVSEDYAPEQFAETILKVSERRDSYKEKLEIAAGIFCKEKQLKPLVEYVLR